MQTTTRSTILQGLDKAILILATISAVLLATGGFVGRFEISQVDAFGWAIVVLSILRFYLGKKLISPYLESFSKKAFHFFSEKPLKKLFYIFGFHVLFYSVILSFRYFSFEANAFDLSFVDQAIWSVFHHSSGMHFFHSTISKGDTYFGEHFSPLLALFSPWYLVASQPLGLFLGQSLLIGSGSIFVYFLFLKQGQKKEVAALFAVLYFFVSPVKAAGLFDLREDVFFVPIFFAMLLSFAHKRWKLFYLFAALSFLVKENAAIATAVFSLVLLKDSKSRAKGAVLLLVSAAAFCIVNLWLMPKFSVSAGDTVFARRFSGAGGSIFEVLKNLLTHPLQTLNVFFGEKLGKQTLKYALQVLLPFLGFAFLNWRRNLFLFLVPIALLGMNILIGPQRIGFHYELILLPFLFYALGFCLQKLPAKITPANAVTVFAILLLCVYGRSPVLSFRKFLPSAEHIKLAQILEQVPDRFSIATQSSLHPHISHRKSAVLFTNAAQNTADVVIVSSLPGLSNYASSALPTEIPKLSPIGYSHFSLPLGENINNPSPVVTFWCKNKAVCTALNNAL